MPERATEKATTPPSDMQVNVTQEVRRALEDSRFSEILDTKIAERLRPIEQQLADIAARLPALGAAQAGVAAPMMATDAGSTSASVVLPGSLPAVGAANPKLEADPRAPEPPVLRERQLGPVDGWNVFDPKDPTTHIPKHHQGTTNP